MIRPIFNPSLVKLNRPSFVYCIFRNTIIFRRRGAQFQLPLKTHVVPQWHRGARFPNAYCAFSAFCFSFINHKNTASFAYNAAFGYELRLTVRSGTWSEGRNVQCAQGRQAYADGWRRTFHAGLLIVRSDSSCTTGV